MRVARISIFSPRLIDCSRQPKTTSTSSSARAQGNLSLSAIMVVRSALVMDTVWLLHFSATFTRSVAASPTMLPLHPPTYPAPWYSRPRIIRSAPFRSPIANSGYGPQFLAPNGLCTPPRRPPTLLVRAPAKQLNQHDVRPRSIWWSMAAGKSLSLAGSGLLAT